MLNQERIAKLKDIVAGQRDLMFAAERHIWKHPETGYREWETHKYLAEKYKELGYELVEAGNIPGFYTDVDTGRPGPKLLIMGELDSLIVATHPECDPETGFVHACGHHAQSAALLGIAAALKQPGALDGMSGSIRLMAVPAEELIEIGYRASLREKGIIKYFGGKVEFMYRGFMDDCDIALLVHTSNSEKKGIGVSIGNNGCLTKNIDYEGVSSHAGGAPHLGVNALYAANLGLNAVNALRETFQEKDYIRFHPIVTRGGGAVNAIPNDVRVESYVRGASIEAIVSANNRINRALASSAAAMAPTCICRIIPATARCITIRTCIRLLWTLSRKLLARITSKKRLAGALAAPIWRRFLRHAHRPAHDFRRFRRRPWFRLLHQRPGKRSGGFRPVSGVDGRSPVGQRRRPGQKGHRRSRAGLPR